MEQPKYVYRHSWQQGDTLFWDNVAVQHARTPFDPKEERALRAVSVDDPEIAVTATQRGDDDVGRLKPAPGGRKHAGCQSPGGISPSSACFHGPGWTTSALPSQ